MNKQCIVAAIQMVSGPELEKNLVTAERLIRRAHQQHGVDLILLPENFLSMSAQAYAQIGQLLAQPENIIETTILDLCNELDICVVAGSMPITQSLDGEELVSKVAPVSRVYKPKQGLVASYQKIHLFDVDVGDSQGSYRESDQFVAGKKLSYFELGAFKFGLSICYDLRFPELYQLLAAQGANVLLVPAAFTKVTGQAHWETLLRARAIENQCYVVASNQGGRHSSKRETWGHSMIIDPWGEVMDSIGIGEDIAVATLELGQLESVRSKMPVAQHRRLKH